MTACRRLEGRIAIVTGAAQGLGEALAHRLGREGAHVTVADIADEKAQEVAAAIAAEYGVRTAWCHCDITDLSQVEAMVKSTVDTFGRLDIMVSNAGILFSGPVDEIDPARWAKVIEVNLVGYFHVARAAATVMKAQKSGSIVQINSKSGKKGSSKNSAYAASKFGGLGLTQSLGLELAEHNVRVNSICPGNLLDSPLVGGQPLQPVCQALGHHRRRGARPLSGAGAHGPRLHLRRCGQRHGVPGQRRIVVHDRPGHQRHRRPGDALITSDSASAGAARLIRAPAGPTSVHQG